MKVSILLNNHNYREYLAAALDSALAQEHPDVQVVVVDDGSTDGSRELLRSYSDRAEVILAEHGGQAAAFNRGMERASGEVVMFLDSDDVLRPTAASRAATALGERPAAARVQFRMEVIDAAGVPTGDVRPPAHRALRSGDLRHAILAAPFDMAWIPTSGNAFRAAALRRIFPIPAEEYGALGADWYVVHLATLLGEVVSVDEIQSSYRVHGANHHELSVVQLDLDHVRRTIGFQQATARALSALADELGLAREDPILSVANIATRLISLRLAPMLHPVPEDTPWRLTRAGVRAALRRPDASWALRMLLIGWCVAMAKAPRPVARQLAELLTFPDRRPGLAQLSGRLHREPGGSAIVEPARVLGSGDAPAS